MLKQLLQKNCSSCFFIPKDLVLIALQLFDKQAANRIEHRKDHNTHIGEDCHIHIDLAKGTQQQAQEFDTQRQHNILVDDAQTFS